MRIVLLQAAITLLLVVPGACSTLRGYSGDDNGATYTFLSRDLDTNSLTSEQYGCHRVLDATVRDPSASSPDDCDTNVCGLVEFSCSESWEYNGLTKITYNISGLTPGLHALHVHQFKIGGEDGDEEETCTSTGGHWNPVGVNHGGNLDAQRHIGDLGNILADETGLAVGSLLAFAPLKGDLGIRGRAVVVHAGTDDLGTGGDDGSRAVGNAGLRPGCGNVKDA